MKSKFELLDEFYLTTALNAAKMSRARRLKVGAVLVANNNIISYGWNGTPAGRDNDCEYKTYRPVGSCELHSGVGKDDTWTQDDIDPSREWAWVSKPEVLHAESNVFSKLLRSGNSPSTIGSQLYLTHSPCMQCANLILQNGVSTVKYLVEYRIPDAVNYLRDNGIVVNQVTLDGV